MTNSDNIICGCKMVAKGVRWCIKVEDETWLVAKCPRCGTVNHIRRVIFPAKKQ